LPQKTTRAPGGFFMPVAGTARCQHGQATSLDLASRHFILGKPSFEKDQSFLGGGVQK
jgi:hypothetical protein